MAFKTFTVATKSVDGTGVSASLKKMGKGDAALAITFRPMIAESFGWKDGDKIEVAIGEDEHHGLVRLRVASDGTAELKKRQAGNAAGKRGGPYYSLALGHVVLFVNRSEAKKWCQFEVVEDGWVEVVLPSWADETSPTGKARARAAAAPILLPPEPKPTATARTASLMGDPPAGRSALSNLSEKDKARLKIRA